MNCTKCGKEIPEGENKLCDECQKVLLEELQGEENVNNNVNEKENKEEKFKVKEGKKEKKKGNKKLLSIILCIVIVVIAIFVLSKMIKTNSVGAEIGNIRNYGYAVQQNGDLYYVAPNKECTKVGIYKLSKGSSDPQELVMFDGELLSLNISGNYLYFIEMGNEAYNDDDEVDNKIYKMKIDGTGLEIINDNEFHNECYEIYAVNNYIYYTGTDKNLYKMKADGSDRKLVLENVAICLGITNKYIIYNKESDTEESGYVTYVSNIDGSNEKEIIKDTRLYSINVENNVIYYTNKNKEICQVNIDGSDAKVLYTGIAAYNMNTTSDYIYYLNYRDEENADYTVCIYKLKTDGTSESPEKIKELGTYNSFINIANDRIIYRDSSEEEAFINSINTNGEDEFKLYVLKYEDYYSNQGTDETTSDETTTDETDVINETTENTDNKASTEN